MNELRLEQPGVGEMCFIGLKEGIVIEITIGERPPRWYVLNKGWEKVWEWLNEYRLERAMESPLRSYEEVLKERGGLLKSDYESTEPENADFELQISCQIFQRTRGNAR